MKTHILALSTAAVMLAAGSQSYGQQSYLNRLPAAVLDVIPPATRVEGGPGEMRVVGGSCQTHPPEELRRRIVDVAAQEWAFFGFSIFDRTGPRRGGFQTVSLTTPGQTSQPQRRRRRFGGPSAQEFSRLVSSIGGYWAATPDGAWMVERNNEVADSSRASTRWRDPWSAAFISWVMCEAGLGSTSRFQRSIAHRDYIDQAIRARDGADSSALYVAYDVGEAEITPGDLLCSGSRPDYQSIAQRRREMGDGARTHCDIVVRVDVEAGRFLTIGGNVGGTVSLKFFPAVTERGDHLHPRDDIFAHLKLRAGPIEANALDNSPTIRALGCTSGFQAPAQLTAMNLPSRGELC
jgi:Uncharacterized protein conserved in bacteria (DUF2272)